MENPHDQEEYTLKNGTEKLYTIFAHIFTKYINGKDILEEWETMYITLTHKMGNKSDYREFWLTSTVSTGC